MPKIKSIEKKNVVELREEINKALEVFRTGKTGRVIIKL